MTATTRTTADVAGELAQRKARQAELTDRRALTSADLQAKRTARARTLAEGSKKGPTAAEIATLQEEYDSIGAALTLLAEDIVTLEAEAQSVAITEAEAAQTIAISAAMEKIAALDAVVREVVTTSILPIYNAYRVALRAARDADNDLDRLRRASSPVPLSDTVTRRRGELLSLLTAILAYTREGRP